MNYVAEFQAGRLFNFSMVQELSADALASSRGLRWELLCAEPRGCLFRCHSVAGNFFIIKLTHDRVYWCPEDTPAHTNPG